VRGLLWRCDRASPEAGILECREWTAAGAGTVHPTTDLEVRDMGRDAVVLWAGKHLSEEEEAATRSLIALLRRTGAHEAAEGFERFLPEREGEWTPDELELGAHAGPWLSMEAEPRAE
jgi:hypothetical protein